MQVQELPRKLAAVCTLVTGDSRGLSGRGSFVEGLINSKISYLAEGTMVCVIIVHSCHV